MKSKLKAIVFDFGGVVVPGVILQWVKNLSDNDPKAILFEEASHKWDLGDVTVDEFYSYLSQITGMTLEKTRSSFYENATYFPDVINLIKKLKKNYKVVLFTNNFSHNIEKYFDKLNMHSLFDEVIISSEHKMKKPDPRFYQKLLDILHMQPSEVVFIDDSQVNVDAGNAISIKSILFTDINPLKKELQSFGIKI